MDISRGQGQFTLNLVMTRPGNKPSGSILLMISLKGKFASLVDDRSRKTLQISIFFTPHGEGTQ